MNNIETHETSKPAPMSGADKQCPHMNSEIVQALASNERLRGQESVLESLNASGGKETSCPTHLLRRMWNASVSTSALAHVCITPRGGSIHDGPRTRPWSGASSWAFCCYVQNRSLGLHRACASYLPPCTRTSSNRQYRMRRDNEENIFHDGRASSM
jgi:hypothetical protein